MTMGERERRLSPERLPGAAARGALVAAAAVAPALAAGGASGPGLRISLLIGLGIGAAVALEYAVRTPALVDFRFAPPVNRLRFMIACAALLGAILAATTPEGGALRTLTHGAAAALGGPWSPVDLAAGAVTRGSALAPDPTLRAAAATALVFAWAAALPAGAAILLGAWPARARRFDRWTNLPTFEFAEGPDAPARLRRTATLVLVTALALPAALAVAGAGVVGVFAADALEGTVATIWAAAIWAAVPPVLALRGVALAKLARLAERGEA